MAYLPFLGDFFPKRHRWGAITADILCSQQLPVNLLEFHPNGGFLSHRGTPSYPFLDGIFPEINHLFCDTPIDGNPKYRIPSGKLT